MRILITNNTLASHAGSEVYARDLALGLLRRGHDPVVYSSILGEVAAELARATVPVIDDLAALNAPPDLIHGQHHLDTMVALLRFPQVPAIYVCHGWSPWQERPPVFPSIRRFLAVDDLCRERLLTTPGIAADRVEVLLNAVDLKRFQARPSLPKRARSALVFSNYAGPGGYGDTVVRACRAHGLERVEVVGSGSGRSIAEPERLLPEFDIVFAKARCAIEAMAVGCAVVVADATGLAGMVDMANVQRLRRLNFGARTMQAERVSDDSVAAALERYDAEDAARVSSFIRGDADLDALIDRLLEIYQEVRAEAPAPLTSESEPVAASNYLASLATLLKDLDAAVQRSDRFEQRVSQLDARAGELVAEHAQELGQRDAEHAQELGQRDANHAQELGQRVAQLDARAGELAAEHALELGQRDASHAQELEQFAARHAQELDQLAAEHALRIDKLEAALAATEQRATARAAQLERQAAALATEIAAQSERWAELTAGAEAEDAALRQSLSVARAENLALQSVLADAKDRGDALAEIHRSRAWRAVTTYRRFRRWLS